MWRYLAVNVRSVALAESGVIINTCYNYMLSPVDLKNVKDWLPVVRAGHVCTLMNTDSTLC